MPEGWIISNLVVALLVAGCAGLVVVVRRNRIWREAIGELWRRRTLAICCLGIYVLVALLDSVSWVGGVAERDDAVAIHEARSFLDRAFVNSREKTYSAPFAGEEFYRTGAGHPALRKPGSHPLGTDILGRDVLYLALKGARVALLIGGLTSLIAIPLALLLGVSAGYFGGLIDDLVVFSMSIIASIPGLLLLIALIMAMGRGTVTVCIALGVISWVGFCRLSRGETFKLRELEFVEAARALGVSELRIVLHHILPNLMHLVIITFVLMFSGLVLSEATLSWLGIGVDGSWGQMIDQARDELSREPIIWWNIAAAGGALFGLLLVVNFVGDALRDILDPRTLRENL
ncbi:MAG: ABC transporter permease [Myxococcota bacterium]